MLEVILFGSIAVLAYVYAGYPLIVLGLGRLFPRPVRKGPGLRSVTIIVSAYNEEFHIHDKLVNLQKLDYPPGTWDVIVVSDASDDRTDAIVSAFHAKNVRLLRVEGRQGKTACQNIAAQAATGEILLFTDANTMLAPGTLRSVVRNFNDPDVGCVCGRLVYVTPGSDATGNGITSYWGYEIALRVAESAIGSLIGVSGSLYAVRRAKYRPIAPDLISDFVIAMDMREQGLRTVIEPEAVCTEEALDEATRELSMRIRVGMRSLSAIAAMRRFLNPLRFGSFAWQLWSHKLLRYLSPVFLFASITSNLALALEGRYEWLLLVQAAGFAAGLVGFLPGKVMGNSRLLAQPYYFLLTNLASAVSLFRFIRGERVVTWRPLR